MYKVTIVVYVLHVGYAFYFSVPVPFKGEYVKLSNNKKWKKTTNNAPVIWADWVCKINRKNGKACPFYTIFKI
jgi:hypothetical protein